MNAAILMIIAAAFFWLAYRFYGRYISKVFEENDANPTPACVLTDDCDYVPTKPIVLFGHHFASIAGGGPIIGPTVAMIFGFIPVWLWAVFGSIFIGAVHDMTTLFASVREKGHSVAEIARSTLGNTGFFLFISFTICVLLLVTSAFLGLTATALTSLLSLDVLKLDPSQTVVKTIEAGGVIKAQIGGIASTSVIIITCFAPIIGFLVYKKGINVYLASGIAIVVCILSVVVGMEYPISIAANTWMIILCFYTLLAAGIPVWIILQPRDFTNSFLLYAGVAALFIGSIAAGLKGVTFNAPMTNIAAGTAKLGPIWPFLFITVACGAISGFHCLVAGGTSSKQVSKESDIIKVGYGGMLLEGLLAIGVLVAVGCGLTFQDYTNIVFPTAAGAKSNPILAFAAGAGGLLDKGLGIRTCVRDHFRNPAGGRFCGHHPGYGRAAQPIFIRRAVAGYVHECSEDNERICIQLGALCDSHVPSGLQQCVFGSLARIRLRESIACLFGADRRIRVAGE